MNMFLKVYTMLIAWYTKWLNTFKLINLLRDKKVSIVVDGICKEININFRKEFDITKEERDLFSFKYMDNFIFDFFLNKYIYGSLSNVTFRNGNNQIVVQSISKCLSDKDIENIKIDGKTTNSRDFILIFKYTGESDVFANSI